MASFVGATSKNIVFRVDSSVEIGSGHLMRCLTLADQLRSSGATVLFISRTLPGDGLGLVEQRGYQAFRLSYRSVEESSIAAHAALHGYDLEQDADGTITAFGGKRPDWLIVDNYAIDASWEVRMRTHTRQIMVIDDLSDRPHDCDLLLDQNLYDNIETRYEGLVPKRCRQLLGARYALLRPEFLEARQKLQERDGHVRRILIFFGGSDPTNETVKALEAVRFLGRADIEVDVVVGAANPNRSEVEKLCAIMGNAGFYCQTDNMAEIMALADLAIGAGGTTTWERCFLGLPTLTIVVAENQNLSARNADKAGLSCLLGTNSEVSAETIATALEEVLRQPTLLRDMAVRCFSLMGQRDVGVHAELLSYLCGRDNAA